MSSTKRKRKTSRDKSDYVILGVVLLGLGFCFAGIWMWWDKKQSKSRQPETTVSQQTQNKNKEPLKIYSADGVLIGQYGGSSTQSKHYNMQPNQDALYVAEMARKYVYSKYGEDAYTQGFQVHTTVSLEHQKVATAALRKALRNFDNGKAYRGAESQLDLSQAKNVEDKIEKYLSNTYAVDGMLPAVITQIDKQFIEVQKQGLEKIKLARTQTPNVAIGNKRMGDRALQVGSVIRIAKDDRAWYVTQQPEIQGALISMDTETGAIRAVVGGYDFHSKAFNRATESKRNLGEVIHPFIYSGGLSKGLKPETLVNDAPFTYRGWSPKNGDGYYSGMIPLREAFIKSRKVVAVRLAHAMGMDYAHRYVQRFGFKPEQIPQKLQMAIGEDMQVPPLQVAEGYAVFANGGYKVTAYVVDKIYDAKGNLRAEMQPLVAHKNAEQIIDGNNAATMNAMLQNQNMVRSNGNIVNISKLLVRRDLGGRAGTSEDRKDVWFVGYNPKIVTAVYMGYDEPQDMGSKAFGSTLALPVWLDYMRFALNGVIDKNLTQPKSNSVQQNMKPKITDNSAANSTERPLKPVNPKNTNSGSINDLF